MNDMFTLAVNMATNHHAGQVDKQGMPYIFHIMAVASVFYDEDRQVVGLLHDIIEDTVVSIASIRHYFPNRIVEAVDAITHKQGEDNMDYIKRCAQNDIARDVKISDVKHNMGRIDQLDDVATRMRLRVKYTKYLAILYQAVVDSRNQS